MDQGKKHMTISNANKLPPFKAVKSVVDHPEY